MCNPFSFRCTPVEALHTIPLGLCKYMLKDLMPKMSPKQKVEILARVKAFNTSGFRVKMYGIVCQYYKSFVGRDFKAWAQMAVFIISPFLDEGQKKVLLSLSKVTYAMGFIISLNLKHLSGVPACLLCIF